MLKEKQIFVFLILFSFHLCVFAEVTFLGDWRSFNPKTINGKYHWLNDGAWYNQDVNRSRWLMTQATDLNRIQIENDPQSPHQGAVAHFVVMSGDDLGYKGGERAEVSRMVRYDSDLRKNVHHNVLSSSGHEFYALSIKLPTNWKPPGRSLGKGPTWGIFLQLHSPDRLNSPPAIALTAENDFHLNICAGNFLVNGLRKDGVSIPFENNTGELNKGHWVQFVIDVVWAADNSGSLTIYRKNIDSTDWIKAIELKNTPTLQYGENISEITSDDLNSPHYWKIGYYRSATENLVSNVWLGPLVRGTSFNEVVNAAFTH